GGIHNMLDLTGVKLPFTVGDVVTGSMALVGIVAGFVILGLAFKIAPKFISLFLNSFRTGGKNS
uniref:hypothetical protein n=2 Tax=cellular organisms TaxID=131567 RepID=UPI000E2A37DE